MANKNCREFLEGISDEKLTVSYYAGETTISKDYDAGFRFDHQGLNDDKREHPFVHRMYIQPIGGKKKTNNAKSHRKGQKVRNDGMCARCHASDEATPQQVRDALLKSYKADGALFYAPPKPDEE